MGEPTRITIEIPAGPLTGVPDKQLAVLWHVAQANPAPHGDRDAGDLAARIGFEIIRRWLRTTDPELYRHQARDYYWMELCKAGKWIDGEFVPGARWENGRVLRPDEHVLEPDDLPPGAEK